MKSNHTAILLATTALALLASPALAQATGDQSGTPAAAGPGQSAASSTNAPAVAAAPHAAPSGDAGDIIVTARRSEERLQDVPISITVFNQDQLTKRNVVSASDLSIYTPSLSTNNRFGADNASYAIRGFVQEGPTSPSVAVYFADVVAPRANGGTTAGNGSGPGSFFDLQNVQVLKGPQGTLFGRNTTGGAVLLVPQKPTSRFEGYVEGSIGNYDMKRIQGVINVPVSDGIRLRLGVDHNQRDGYLHNRSGIGPSDFADTDYTAVRGSLVLDLAPSLENYTIGSYSISKTNGFYPKVTICNPAGTGLTPLACAQIARGAARGDGFYDVENGNPVAFQRTQQWQAINTTTWTASDTITIKNIASYSQFRQDVNANIFGENLTSPFLPVPITYVGLYQAPGYHNVSQKSFTEELQLQGRTGDGKLTYQAGAYYEKSTPLGGFQATRSPIALACTNVAALQCLPTGGFIQESPSEYTFRNIGLYAQATYKFTDKLSVTGGFRYTMDKTTGASEIRMIFFPAANTPVPVCSANPLQSAPTPDVCYRSYTENSKKPTWLIDLDYKPTDDILLYGKYSRGYRQGGVNSNNFAALITWDPEQVDTYEVGAKTSWHGAMPGFLNFAGFYNNFTNQQLQANAITVGSTSPNAGIVNAGKSRIWGIELDGSVTLFTGFRLDGSYAYLNTKLLSFTAPAFDTSRISAILPTSAPGGPLTFTPKNKVTLTGTYTLPLDRSIGKVSIGATFTHTDKQLASATTPNGELPGYDLVNVNVNWDSVAGLPVDLSVFVTNLTQKHYAVSVGGSYPSFGYDSIITGEPRMIGARLRYRFGR